MRIFTSAVAAVKEIEREVQEMGHRVKGNSFQNVRVEDNPDYETKEIVGYSFTLTNGSDWRSSFEALGMEDASACIDYVDQEVGDRLFLSNNLNPGHSWKKRPQVWEKFLDICGTFHYTYPERIHRFSSIPQSQIRLVHNLHSQDPHSRQLIISIYDQAIDHKRTGGQGRIPCTMHYQILHRGDYLYVIHNMRSLDLYTHLAVDLSIAWVMADYFNSSWGTSKTCARVVMQVGSLHAFQKDLKKRKPF